MVHGRRVIPLFARRRNGYFNQFCYSPVGCFSGRRSGIWRLQTHHALVGWSGKASGKPRGEEMNFTGIFFALFTVVTIGLGFVWVIKLEYYVGSHVAKAVAVLGILVVVVSLFMPSFTLSAIVGIIGGTIVWGATELPDQEERVAEGMFPANPRKQARRQLEEGEG
ncbi:MAG: hypothetical protein CSB13_11430 [Chloroflexi bacterium]|nr:MAG: hypothetical protein CSB13_11430 [Chloroflexota bacterium]